MNNSIEKTIELIKDLGIADPEEFKEIIDRIKNPFNRGYLVAKWEFIYDYQGIIDISEIRELLLEIINDKEL